MTKNEIYFPNLDGLRFIAFFAVFLMHAFSPAYSSLHLYSTFANALFHFLANGESGVTLFFVLSGFLITYLLIREQDENGKIHIGFFYMRRILRIWPLYYALVVLVIIIFPLMREAMGLVGKIHDSNNIWYFFFLGNFDVINLDKMHGQGFRPLGITWSVAVEEQFYLLWPLLLSVVKKQGRLWMIVAVFIVSFCFRVTHANDPMILYYHSLSLIGDMAIGGLGAYLITHMQGFKSFMEKLSLQQRGVFYILGFCLLFLNGWFQYKPIPYFNALSRLPEALFFIFIILDQNFNQSLKWKLSSNRFITHWGKYTYGLYLLHPLALYLFDAGFFKLTGLSNEDFVPLMLRGLMALPVTFVMAYLSYWIIEQRFLRLKNKFTIFKPVA